jgi:hypothetical protein
LITYTSTWATIDIPRSDSCPFTFSAANLKSSEDDARLDLTADIQAKSPLLGLPNPEAPAP